MVWHLKQIGKVKKLNTWVPPEQTEKQTNKKNVVKCHFPLFYATTANHFLIGLWHVTKSGFYMTTIDDQLSVWTKKKLQSTSQNQICTKKKKGCVGGSCSLVVCCWSDPLQLSESWWNHYIWEVCSANQWDARKTACLQPGLVNRKSPWPISFLWQHSTTCYTTKTSKLERTGL